MSKSIRRPPVVTIQPLTRARSTEPRVTLTRIDARFERIERALRMLGRLRKPVS